MACNKFNSLAITGYGKLISLPTMRKIPNWLRDRLILITTPEQLINLLPIKKGG
jgi:hypothetical protein